MTNVEALQALYAALGGEPADVANASTIVEVLNAIAAKFDGENDAKINPDAIANIAAVAGNITPDPSEYNAKFVAVTSGSYKGLFDVERNLQKVIIPNGTTNLGANAFEYYTALTEVIIPEGLLTIDANAFLGCSALKHITLPSTVTTISNNTFQGSHFETITINKPEGSISGAPWNAPSTTQIIWAG